MKKVLFIVLIMIMVNFAVVQAQINNDYCINPIFSNDAEKPNIMIVMDHSGSMQFPAYVPCVWGGYNGSSAICGSSTSGVNSAPFYNSARTYYAYFDSTKNYSYNAAGYFQESACTPSTAGGCFSGNLLNFVTATRIDVARKILTGGRTRTIGGQLTFDNEGGGYTFTETALHCRFTLSDQNTGDPTTRRIAISNQPGFTCDMGTLGVSNINIAISATPTGIIDQFKDKATFESMIYNSTGGNQGLIRTRKQLNNSTDIDSLKTALNTQTPYNGTPTGEALWEAYDFFKQMNDHAGPNNAFAIDRGNGSNDRDPWYDGVGANRKAVPCRKSFVLLISDGAWNGDIDPVRAAREMRVNDIRSDLSGTQNVTTYTIYAFGDNDPSTRAQGRNAMITTAIFGGHDYVNLGDWPYPFVSFTPGGNCPTVLTPAEDVTPRTSIRDVGGTTFCNSRYTPNGITSPAPFLSQCAPPGAWDTRCGNWDRHETGPNGLPYNFFEADDPADLETRLTDSLNDMLRRASSGSGVAMVGSAEGSGANLLQGLFYPKKVYGTSEVRWIGELKNLWYFMDPYILRSSVREDTDLNNILTLSTDLALRYHWNETEQKTYVRKYRDDTPTTQDPRLPPAFTLVGETDHDGILSLWEAGVELHHRDPADRVIWANASGKTRFNATNAGILGPYINPSSATDALDTINYVMGTDSVTYRNRTVMAARRGEAAISGTWKLGDIVSSTARIMSGEPLNDYAEPTPNGYGDRSYLAYTQQQSYKDRGMVFVGANDGMLHAFELGGLRQIRQPDTKAELNPNARGRESWAFIPQNVLPYLTYLKGQNYQHVFTVDGHIMLADVSYVNPNSEKDVNSWKTVLIGSMGIGGASRNKVIGTPQCPSGSRCVETPLVGKGFSSYFALDVGTNPADPEILWEFTHPRLGFSTTGAAIVKTNAGADNPKLGGNWYAVFASGPTGPIDTTENQFKADSDQNLHIFVLDLRTGTPVTIIDTGISRAFGGALGYASVDVDRWKFSGTSWYSDDVLYMGFNRFDAAANRWKGGVIRVIPGTWSWSIVVDAGDYPNLGPVTSAVSRIQDSINHNLWLFFGTGRYNFKLRDGTTDDPINRQTLFGVRESASCYTSDDTFNSACNARGTVAWSHIMDDQTSDLWTERCVTTPITAPNGNVFFISFAPTKEICKKGGTSKLRILRYDTGSLVATSSGKVMVMLGGGVIAELGTTGIISGGAGPSSAFGGAGIFPPVGKKSILHIKER